MQAFVEQHAVGAQIHQLFEFLPADLHVLLASKAHGNQALGVDIQQLGGRLIFVARMLIVIA